MTRWIITSAWPYINSVPHLGTLLHLVTADVITRYRVLFGDQAIFVSGSDAYGTPNLLAAEKEGISPEEFVRRNHQKVLEILAAWNVQADNYTVTCNDQHKTFIQAFHKDIYTNGYIFEKETLQFYCPSCQRFLPDRFVNGICPKCGFPNARGDQCQSKECGTVLDPLELGEPTCAVCGSTPNTRKTNHWYFDLPRFEKQIRDLIANSKHLSAPSRASALNIMRRGLRARPLTRDLSWGIPAGPSFKGADDKTFYVWSENVLGYLSACSQALKSPVYERVKPTDDWEEWWKDPDTKTVFCIGKDNVIFHLLLFPAYLMASGRGYVLPYNVATTQYVLFEGELFSKSAGIGVTADEAIELAPSDYWRFYLLWIRPELQDTNFSWVEFATQINSGLADAVGNLLLRVLTLLSRSNGGRTETLTAQMVATDDETHQFVQRHREQVDVIVDLVDSFKLSKALKETVRLADQINRFLSGTEPWKLFKSEDPADKTRASCVVSLAHAACRTVALLLWPVVPDLAQKVLTQLGLDESPSLQNKETLFMLPSGQEIGDFSRLVEKVDAEELKNRFELQRLKKADAT